MNATLVDAALDWPSQKADFERDGSLRDIYVHGATIDDWRLVVARVLDGSYHVELRRRGAIAPVPTDFETIFDGNDRHLLSFTVGGLVLDCHFFTPTEIEFSFSPNELTESALRDLLGFIVDIGDAIRKPVVMTQENSPQLPIFWYDPDEQALRWVSPQSSSR